MNAQQLLLIVIIFFTGIVVSHAQEDCGINNTVVIEEVERECRNVGANEVCYGNNEVRAVPRAGVTGLDFTNPGDRSSVSNILSLNLSALNTGTSTWGVAQMRLLVSQASGTQDVTMLLFGDVELENAVEETDGIDVVVRRESATIYNQDSADSLQLATVTNGTTLTALGRRDNNVWVRVRVPETGAIGWVLAGFIRPRNTTQGLDSLPTQSGDTPYYGAMQAFSFISGNSTDCTGAVADGLLIQTPEGEARVSLLINEVSIELTSASSGASAFVQANPEQDGMSINVLDGTAYVETSQGSQRVDAGMQTNIPLSVDLSPLSAPSFPQTFDTAQIHSIPLLPVVRDPNRPSVPEANPLPQGSGSNPSVTIGGSGGGSNTQSGSGNTTNNSDGGQVQSSNSNTGGNTNTGSGSTGGSSTTNIGGSGLGGGDNSSQTSNSGNDGEVNPANVIFAIAAVIFGVVFVVWMVVRSRTFRTG